VGDAETQDEALAGRPIVAEGADMVPYPDEQEDEELAGPEPGRDRWRRDRGRHERGPAPTPPVQARSLPPLPLDLGSLGVAARALLTPDLRPAFLGGGSFGGPWNRGE
jgi:hypothetical protein